MYICNEEYIFFKSKKATHKESGEECESLILKHSKNINSN